MRITSARGLALLSGAAVVVALGTPGPATADPKGEVVPLDCDDGTTYLVAVNGNGAFSPGHDTASTATVVPVSFGEFTGMITDEAGNVLETFVDPPVSKGNASLAEVSCTFSFTETFEDPELGTLTFTGSGSVEVFVTPRR